MLKRIGKKWLLIGLVALVFGGAGVLAWAIPALAEGSCTPAPTPYETLFEQYGTTSEGEMVYISRAIVAREQGVEIDGRAAIELPRCWSRDNSLITITNLDVTLTKGERVTIIVGVVGRERLPLESTPPPQ